MTLRLKALRSLRWNYRWSGVWFWLKGRQRCRECNDTGYVLGPSADGTHPLVTLRCPRCRETRRVRGYQRVLHEPERVIAEQTAMAEGVFV